MEGLELEINGAHLDRRFGGVLGPEGLPPTGKSDSVRSRDAKLCVRAREIAFLTLGLRIQSFPSSPPSPPSPSLMAPCFLHGFYDFDIILAVICMGLCEPRSWLPVFCMGFMKFS